MWYVVQVLGGKEEATCRLIERIVDQEVLQECFTPRYETQRKVRGMWVNARNVLFPGYVIAVTEDVDRLKRELRAVPEFTKLLSMGEAFIPLSEQDQAWIGAFTSPGERTVPMSEGVIEGDRVIVTSGPLKQHEGWIRSVNRRKGLAFLEFQMFGRTIQTKVGLAILARRAGKEE